MCLLLTLSSYLQHQSNHVPDWLYLQIYSYVPSYRGDQIPSKTFVSMLPKLSKLRELHISSSGLRDADLATIASLTSLRVLYMRQNPQITHSGVIELKTFAEVGYPADDAFLLTVTCVDAASRILNS
jgi:hypothetical protein